MCEARALRARETLTDFFTDSEKKKLTVLQSTLVMNTGHTYSVCDPLFT